MPCVVSVVVECAFRVAVQTYTADSSYNRRKMKLIFSNPFTSTHEVVDSPARRCRTPYESPELSSEIAGCQQLFSHVPTVLQRQRLER